MSDWAFAYDEFDPERERQREALFTLANGYMGTRAAVTHARADDVHYPGTYLAGIYNRAQSEIEGQIVNLETMPNAPNWLQLTWRIDDGEWFDLREVTIDHYREELDIRRGVLTREFTVEDDARRRTQVRERRFVHIRHCHLAGLEMTIHPENWSGRLEVSWAIDGRVENALVESDRQLNADHLRPVDSGACDDEVLWLKTETTESRIKIDVTTRTRLRLNDARTRHEAELHSEPGFIGQATTLDVNEGDTITVEKVAAIFTSRDPAISESGHAARRAIADAPDFEMLLQSHVEAWHLLWGRCDIAMEDGTNDAQMIVRLHLFHVLQTASVHTRYIDTGLLARGLSGEAYHGHIFWDELMVLPYLNLHFPSISRTLLQYRFLRLGEARRRAKDAGYAGAMYPWQSGSTGQETTPPFYPNPRTGGWMRDYTPLQRHIGAVIAYNAWHYVEVTDDREYLITEGAEMLLEIARFWSSIATFNPEHERYEIHGVMGPDEFHSGYPWSDEPGLSNNTYTNVMAVRTLRTALAALERLPAWRRDELRQTLDLGDNELERWRDIAHRMRIIFLESGELAQFEHYERLEELDWNTYREKYGDLQRLDYILDAEGDTPNRYRIAKQPDVLMLFYVLAREELEHIMADLGYEFDDKIYRRTVKYYTKRSSRGSTLSRVVEAEIMAGLDGSASWQCLQAALQSDVGDIQGGSTGEGIHLGAMGGTIAIIERRYTGLDASGDVLHFNPALPDELQRLSMQLVYREQWIDVELSQRRLKLTTDTEATQPVTVAMGARSQQLTPATPIDWPW
ncbi:MAG TPA: glycosyl hydrolase family 65 protein [Thermomicrobiales bacterium]|nr:glycosyl hydrolase family 65 protein [Thermomicrobiales bacterium]